MTSEFGRKQDSFLLFVTGQVSDMQLPEVDHIDCKYMYQYGNDWKLLAGTEQATSQSNAPSPVPGQQYKFVINLPLEVTFKATCPYGWPQLVLCCYGQDFFGNSIVRGYGAVHIPTTPGSHERWTPLFVPEPSSSLQRLTGWLMSRRPEFADPRFVAQADNREITRVRSTGKCRLLFNVVTKGLKSLAYDNVPRGVQTLSEFALAVPMSSLSVQDRGDPSPLSPPAVQSPPSRRGDDDVQDIQAPPSIASAPAELTTTSSSSRLEPLVEEEKDETSSQ